MLADVSQRMLASRAGGLYLGRFQLEKDACDVPQDRGRYLRACGVLLPSPRQRAGPVGNREGADDLVRGRVHRKLSTRISMIVDIDVRIGPNEMGASSPQRQRPHGRAAWSGCIWPAI